jgi:4-amino-4-deoxy-L-arabinose transferase-like glycosyltransferase
VVGTLTARELDGGRRAQLLAALGTATMPVVVAADHLDGPTASDMLAWAALALVVVRVGRTGDTRGWLAGGAVLGVGLTNKHSVGSFAVAVLVGLSRAAGAGSSSTADSSPAPCSPPPSSSRISASRHRTAGRPSR